MKAVIYARYSSDNKLQTYGAILQAWVHWAFTAN